MEGTPHNSSSTGSMVQIFLNKKKWFLHCSVVNHSTGSKLLDMYLFRCVSHSLVTAELPTIRDVKGSFLEEL